MRTPDELMDRLGELDPVRHETGASERDSDWARRMRDEIAVAPGSHLRRRERARRAIRLGFAACAIVAVGALMAVLLVATGGEDRGSAGREVVLLATPRVAGQTVDEQALDLTAARLQERAALLGADRTEARTAGDGRIVLMLPADADPDLVERLLPPGRLRILSYERSLVGEALADRDAAVALARREAGQAPRGGSLQDVPAGMLVVREEVAPGGDRWLVLRDQGGVRPDDVAGARYEPTSPEAAVAIAFTPDGQGAFTRLTRQAAQDGALRGRLQRLAVVLDDRLLSVPVIDHERNPIGLDGRDGLTLPLSPTEDAEAIAARLEGGPLPLRLAVQPDDASGAAGP